MDYWYKDKQNCILSPYNSKKTHYFDNKKTTLANVCHSAFYHLRLPTFYGLIIHVNEGIQKFGILTKKLYLYNEFDELPTRKTLMMQFVIKRFRF